ncbi:MAG: chemotaxis protein CheR [Sphingomonas sanxanigenens]|uniref:Chemotaxis protein CheR n=1 Tax=Sphingomonas sanxanigenens TaxID=397260 RepID=A0A2W5BX52_9SPHN|nr:MAG: chemotaxis protein CheR [Sphingomonas sanxanigenens]
MRTITSPTRFLADLLERHTGQQLAENRLWRVEAALRPLLREKGLTSLAALADLLASGGGRPLEVAAVEAMLNNETFFFRDQAVFTLFQTGALEKLREARAKDRRLRIWSAGCSTGQEAYSLAMIFADSPARWDGWSIDLIASDISQSAIDQARAGRFSQFEIQRGLPVLQMLRWFEQKGDQWVASAELGSRIRFQRHNLLDPAPFAGRADAILCRNLLLYFTPDRRRTAFARLAGACAKDGYLMLGAGETVIGQTEDFVSDPGLRGLYRPREFLGARHAA